MISRTRRIRNQAERIKFHTKTRTGGDPLRYLDNRSVELLLDRVELLLHGHDLLVAVSDFVFGISGLLLGGLEFVLDLKKGSISAEKSIQTFWSRSLAELSSSSVAFCFLRSA